MGRQPLLCECGEQIGWTDNVPVTCVSIDPPCDCPWNEDLVDSDGCFCCQSCHDKAVELEEERRVSMRAAEGEYKYVVRERENSMNLTLMEAIAKLEGFGIPGTIPTRCNNPGDIIAGAFANKHGAIPNAPDPKKPDGPPFRYAVFPDVATGYKALQALLQGPNYMGRTIEQIINRYAPPVENDTCNYVEFVCRKTGHSASTVLTPEMVAELPEC